jgi:hypothetical protein
MKVGDLVRPKASQFQEQVGIVIAVGFLGAVGIRLMNGTIATYNKGSLEVISESR